MDKAVLLVRWRHFPSGERQGADPWAAAKTLPLDSALDYELRRYATVAWRSEL